MSRIGKAPIVIPQNVTVKVEDGNFVKVKGAKGELARQLHQDMKISIENGQVIVERPSESKQHKALHGLTRTLLSNMVTGVYEGFEKELHLVGVGYKIIKQGEGIQISCGYSHPVEIAPIKGISFEIETEKGVIKLKIKGIDREKLGQVAADIRFIKPPEPYKGKGFKYSNEVIIRKLGKAGKTGK